MRMVGVDVGGTFTDAVVYDDATGELRWAKAPSTPAAPAEGVLAALAGNDASLGKVIGPSFAANDMPDVIARLIETYIAQRHADERFIDTVRRVGIEPFKERVYATTH